MIAGASVGRVEGIQFIEGGSMGTHRWNHRKNIGLDVKLGIAMLLGVCATAQDVKLHVTYVCNGERIFVDSCNIRDLSDTSTCMVGHPDRPTRNGIMAYTNETRGTLKKLFPTCKQPTPQELAAAEAREKKQKEIYDANVAKANPQPNPQANNQGNAGRAQAPQGVARPNPAQERRGTRHAPLHLLRTASGHLHRQLAPGRLWPDGRPGSARPRQGTRPRPGARGGLRGRR